MPFMAFGETLREPFLESSMAARGGEAANSARLRGRKARQSKTAGQTTTNRVMSVMSVMSSQADVSPMAYIYM